MSILDFTPKFSVEKAQALASKFYGIDAVDIRSLPGERDQNFLIEESRGRRQVLKISDAAEARSFLEAQCHMLHHLESRTDLCAKVILTGEGERIATVDGDDGQTHMVRMVTYLEGDSLAGVKYRCPELLQDIGSSVGKIDVALRDFDHEALHREFHWDLQQAGEIVRSNLHCVEDRAQRRLIENFLKNFESVRPVLAGLPRTVIHNDPNDGNIIIEQRDPGTSAARVVGIIDFGDAVHSWTLSSLAIAIAYAILGKRDPLQAAVEVVKGYHAERPINADEVHCLNALVGMRLGVSAVLAAVQQKDRPDDPYLSVSQAPIRELMPRLARIPGRFWTATYRDACGLPAIEQGESICSWLRREQSTFVFPVEHDAKFDEIAILDLSVSSALLRHDPGIAQNPLTARAIERELSNRGAKLGVGRYLEPRTVYSSDAFREEPDQEEERRTIHLGMDIFAGSGSRVLAPLEGTVTILEERTANMDYGTMVVLRHETDKGLDFFTLFGHLARRTLEHLEVGQRVERGELIAWLGTPEENGGWMPHLHFQIILDTLDLASKFPGVGQASRLSVWSAISPDPNLILALPDSLFPGEPPTKPSTLARRKKRIGGNLSVGYLEPVKVVRGWKQYLYDETGRKYIDAYNNVPHVGHCHPHVVAAAEKQQRLLNTNTRYLSDLLNDYAARLSSTMPDPLNVCFILNSASEANELALRLARAYTKQRDMIVLEGAYHGNTTTLIDISPYKHDGPGGEGAPDWVHTAPLADVYRGEHRDAATAGPKYATAVDDIVDSLKAGGRGLCAFIAESCPSVGGQIIFPKGYLAAVYEKVRKAGGVCIADDVQTGYGRLGKAFYGFELQEVVPDIVVLGKPIGNGHPIAALVTTAEIADAFDNGMEFFSTFGGNTVSCAVGLAVLDVLERENLPAHAAEVGNYLLAELAVLKERLDIIGDVRGAGLFLGIELVRDHKTLEPAAEEASFIANRMRDRGVLVGTDGPLHNVVKIRPPMPFNLEDARVLVEMLARSFDEL